MGNLQPIEFDQSNYARPTQKWVCNHDDGSTCRRGPNADGSCGATSECQPLLRGERWFCTGNSGSGEGCKQGPNPDGSCPNKERVCVPKPVLRSNRGWWSRGTILLAFGLVLIALGSRGSSLSLLSPGELTVSHSTIAGCSDCHGIYKKDLTAWLHSAFGLAADSADDRLCLICHNLGVNANRAHTMDPNQLKARATHLENHLSQTPDTSLAVLQGELSKILHPLPDPMLAIACATCHRDHQGRDHALIEEADRPFCNTCHQRLVAGFPDDHPEFPANFGQKPTAILFDHGSHWEKHFLGTAKSKAPKDCSGCHKPDQKGHNILTVGFRQACASCHMGEILGDTLSGFKGFPVFSVPGLDLETLQGAATHMGYWPPDSEALLTPFMAFLLAGDKSFRDDLQSLGNQDLLELDPANSANIAQIERMGWQVKSLWYSLLNQGQPALANRLAIRLGRPIPDENLGWVAGLLSADIVAIGNSWFPNLEKELSQHSQQKPPLTVSSLAPPQEDTTATTQGEQQQEDDAQSVEGGDDGLLLDNEEEDGGLLGDTDDDGGLLGDADDDGGLLGDEDDDGGLLDDEEGVADSTPKIAINNNPQQTQRPEVIEPVTGENWSPGGGWFRQGYALYYRPTGHGDLFLKNWLELAGRESSADAKTLFQGLTDKKVPGACIKCHRVTNNPTGERSISWQNQNSNGFIKGFTRFSHAPHLSLGPSKECKTCHRLSSQEANSPDEKTATTQAAKATTPSPGFAPFTKKECGKCHKPNKSIVACRSCHNYHVGNAISQTMLEKP